MLSPHSDSGALYTYLWSSQKLARQIKSPWQGQLQSLGRASTFPRATQLRWHVGGGGWCRVKVPQRPFRLQAGALSSTPLFSLYCCRRGTETQWLNQGSGSGHGRKRKMWGKHEGKTDKSGWTMKCRRSLKWELNKGSFCSSSKNFLLLLSCL